MPVNYGSLPFAEALTFLRSKLNLPTERWDDLDGTAHDRAFVVAGAMQADLLMDLRAAVEKAVEQGTTLETFRQDFKKIVADRGWTGWTGEGSKAGQAWRTRVIYETNLFTSYAAGRYTQMMEVASDRPYWRYRHSDASVTPRAEHEAWDGVIRKFDDAWWSTHSPPNGWGCKCYIETLSAREMAKNGLAVTPTDRIPYNQKTRVLDRKTGEEITVPQGVDLGWDHQPGANAKKELADLIASKRAGWPDELQRAFDDRMAQRPSIATPPALEFRAHTSAKAAAQWAMENDLVDFADYGRLDIDVVNEINRSLFEHIRDFPLLRKNQKFIGSAQRQYQKYYDMQVKKIFDNARLSYPDEPDDVLLARAKDLAKKFVNKPKVNGKSYAHSWSQKDVSGVAVNEKCGASAKTMSDLLRRDVEMAWHPQETASAKAVVDHELGHQLDTLLSLGDDPDINSLWEANRGNMRSEVSGYAGTNIAEFVAESWSEYRNNPAPRPVAKKVGAIIVRRYKDAAAATSV